MKPLLSVAPFTFPLHLLAGSVLAASLAAQAPSPDDASLWRMSRDPGVIETGRGIFNTHCAVCHLESMRGKAENAAMIGPDLTDDVWDFGGTPAEILATIANGLIDKGMPVWRDVLDSEQLSAVTAYVLSRHREGAPVAPGAGDVPAFDHRRWVAGFDEVPLPVPGESPFVSQFLVQLPEGNVLEGLGMSYADGTMVLYDLAQGSLHSVWDGARIRRDRGSHRSYFLDGREVAKGFFLAESLVLLPAHDAVKPIVAGLAGYVRLPDGVSIRSEVSFAGATLEWMETLRLVGAGRARRLEREISCQGVPAGSALEFRTRLPEAPDGTENRLVGSVGRAVESSSDGVWLIRLEPDPSTRECRVTLIHSLPEGPPSSGSARAATPPPPEATMSPRLREEPFRASSLSRPGYRAVRYPLPELDSGENRVLPFALATDPKTGRVFVASGKLGEVFVLQNPAAPVNEARFKNFGGGLFQTVFGLRHDGESLLVAHRRNVTRLRDTDSDGVADHFEHVASLPQSTDPKAYDYAYGLVTDKSGRLVLSFAPHANKGIVGSGGAVRLVPRERGLGLEAIAFGMRNPLGWCVGPEGEIFFTDNQGNWVATNKLSHLVPGRFYGFPNPEQPEHAERPMGPTPIWVPYSWAKSINGVAYDTSGGKFGPFAGQFFMAELMEGGAIIRAQLEKVKGQYQGACFPFWDRGLLGPLMLTFDAAGRLWVGSVTEPGWMRQPDRGALYRIDFTGAVPFEIESVHARPRGFRLTFTTPPNRRAREAISYRVEHYRYEYSQAYGSPELDRTPVTIESVEVLPDGRSVELRFPSLVRGRIYRIEVERGVNSLKGQPLLNAQAAYTLNEIPDS